MITPNDILTHLPHVVKDAPHLAVCACGEVFHAVPAQATAMQIWAGHMTEALNVALTGARGPQ